MSKDSQYRARARSRRSVGRALGAAAIALVTAAPAATAATWTPGGIAFVNATSNQSNLHAVSDGRGGFIVVWVDARNTPSEIYAQRVDSTGAAQWTANGTLVCSTFSGITGLTAAPDDQDGILLAWSADLSAGRTNIYVQRLDASGTAQWGVNGLRVDVTTVNSVQSSPTIASDGAGGAVVAWVDGRGADDDVYVKRVLSDSTRAWTAGGVLVAVDPDQQLAPRVVEDGSGGAFVSWEDLGPPRKTHFQHFDATGAPVFATTFTPATSGSAFALMAPQGLSDTLMIVWSAPNPSRIFGAKLDPGGAVVTGGGTSLVSTGSAPVGLVSQGTGGALLVYASNAQIDALAMNALGANGVGAATLASGQTLGLSSNITVVGDGADGLFCVWASSGKAFARHLTSAAANDWGAPVALVTGVTSTQTNPVAVGGTDLLAAWIDDRNFVTTGADLFAQRASFTGVTGTYYRILTSIAAGSGTLTPSAGRTWVREGDSLRVSCTGSGGQHVDHLVVGATSLVAVPNYTFHGVTGDSALAVHFSSLPIVTQVAAVASAYRAFSVPSTFASDAPTAVFANLLPYDTKRWRLGHWAPDDSSYLEPSGTLAHILPGDGFWFIGVKDTLLSFAGSPVPQALFTLPMLGRAPTGHGWTQFGSPFQFPVAVSQLRLSLGPDVPITTPSNNLTDQQVFEWDPTSSSYTAVNLLLPGHVYWLWRQSAAAISLRFPFEWNPIAAGATAPLLENGVDWAVVVTARANTHTSRLVLGAAPVAPGGWNGLSSHVIPAVARDGISLVARVSDWGEDDGEYQSVFRPDGEALAWDLDANATGGLTEASLTFAFTNLPSARRVVLSEPSAGWSRELRPADAVSLVLSSTPRRLRLEVVAGASVAPRPPAVTALRTLGPNPFRDETTLSFTLAVAGPLRWEVFDLAGRRVVSVVRELPAGEHALTWDGRDASGRRVGPGLYLLRWQADGRSGSARLVRAD